MAIHLNRAICQDYAEATSREWLVTNGIGGYASGTVSGVLTRRYHGLLIAALNPPLARTLLLATLDESVTYAGETYAIATNRWSDGTIAPAGYRHLETFYLDGTTPYWHCRLGNAALEKRVWMQPKANTTYITYTLKQAQHPIKLSIKALVNYRDHHEESQPWPIQVMPQLHGIRVQAFDTATPFYLFANRGDIRSQSDWYYNFDMAQERYRGLCDRDNHFHAATLNMFLQPGEMLTFVATTEPNPNLNGETAILERRHHEQSVLLHWQQQINHSPSPPWIQQLVLAADQFVVDRPRPNQPDGKTIIAGYPWFGDWGRDTMISLPGLTLATGRPAIARTIIQTFSHYLDRGMLPNVFPEVGEQPHYNTVDAILWYFEAVRAYHSATQDDVLLAELFPLLAEVIDWHRRGTRHRIQLDQDGLIYAGESGVQLTWMDAKVGDWVVTPRIGKPIEISALWYNALCSMVSFAEHLGQPSQEYQRMVEKTFLGFQRFWNPSIGYCHDVLDSPAGNDSALRPNQLFAVSLPFVGQPSLLQRKQQQKVLAVIQQQLLTPYGLRSLSPEDAAYETHYGGNQYERDRVYHQGIVWGWLLGPYVQAHLKVYQTPSQSLSMLEQAVNHLTRHGLGTVSEIFDGNAPYQPRGCIAQAWSVAEILRTWFLVNQAMISTP